MTDDASNSLELTGRRNISSTSLSFPLDGASSSLPLSGVDTCGSTSTPLVNTEGNSIIDIIN